MILERADLRGIRCFLKETAPFWLLLCVAGVLRFAGLGRHPLWFDEANTVLIAWKSLGQILEALVEDANPPLFYWLLHGWMEAFGSTEGAVRSLPALFGVLSVVAIFLTARSLFPELRMVAFVAMGVVTLSPLHVYYSQECRMYSLVCLLGILALLTLHHALQSGRAGAFALHSVVLILGLYTHNYFLFVLPVGLMAVWFVPTGPSRRRMWTGMGIATAAAMLVYLPWVPVLVDQASSAVNVWIVGLWEQTPPRWALVRSFEVMGVGGAFPQYLSKLAAFQQMLAPSLGWTAFRWIAGIGAAGLLLGGVGVGLGRGERGPVFGTVFFLALPLLASYILSFLLEPIYVVGRYEIIGFGAFALLVARGFTALAGGRRPLTVFAAAVAGTWIAAAAFILYGYFTTPAGSSDVRLAGWIRGIARAGDVFILPDYARTVPEYYLTLWGVPGERLSFPGETARHLGWFDYRSVREDFDETATEARHLASRLKRTVAAGKSVYLIRGSRNPEITRINRALFNALVSELGSAKPAWNPNPGQRPIVVVFGKNQSSI